MREILFEIFVLFILFISNVDGILKETNLFVLVVLAILDLKKAFEMLYFHFLALQRYYAGNREIFLIKKDIFMTKRGKQCFILLNIVVMANFSYYTV